MKTKDLTELKIFSQSFTATAVEGEYIINGIKLNAIPFENLDEVKNKIKKFVFDLIEEEIRKPEGNIDKEIDNELYINPDALKIKDSIIFVLSSIYFTEFKEIDGLRRHPLGSNFKQWLIKKGLYNE